MRKVVILIFVFCILHSNCHAQEIPAPQNISLDLKGMDILDVLKMFSQRANLNIVVGKNVTGRVTLFLKDVDLWDAFELILLANDLAYDKKGDIINVMAARDYELIYGKKFADKKELLTLPLKYAKAVDLSKALTQLKSDIGKIIVDEGTNTLIIMDLAQNLKTMETMVQGLDLPIQTKVFELNYATAEKLSPKIQELLSKGIGTIKIDERTNKLVISDFPERIKEIEAVIKAFDEKTLQVLIDAQIIEVKPSDKFEMGVDWDAWISKNFRFTSSLPLTTSNKLSFGMAAANLALGEKFDKKGIIDLLRTIGDTKILSSPRIMALNNQEAKILVGTKDAYITSTTSQGGTGTTVTSQAVNFVDVGIKLYVTPTINRDGFVTMKIKPEISSATRTDITSEGKVTQIPIVTTSETETAVMVKDGVTIIIGGLRKDERSKTVKKIPFIGDIPLVGLFFRSTSDELKKTELVILLTPHIMSGETPYTDFSEIKPTEGAVVKMEKGKIITEKISQPKKLGAKKELNPQEYYLIIRKNIEQALQQKFPSTLKIEVELLFSLLNTGELIGEPKLLKITQENLKPLVIEILKSASPFPPFPESIKKDKEDFRILISYNQS